MANKNSEMTIDLIAGHVWYVRRRRNRPSVLEFIPTKMAGYTLPQEQLDTIGEVGYSIDCGDPEPKDGGQ